MSKPKITMTDGSPVTPDHREIHPWTGMQKGYVVLSSEERAKGFVRPVRRSYVHEKCGTVTKMGESLSETYARQPELLWSDVLHRLQRSLSGRQGWGVRLGRDKRKGGDVI